jgi:CubicO group peptidase (beta-lactamase class C family)
MSAADLVQGSVAPGFEPVRDEFIRNFRERNELGSGCAAFIGGENVVDLWGGVRNRRSGEPWEQDTLALIFSTTKGLAATAFAMAHSRGWFGLDEPVARYWPQFAQAGKERITVRELLTHRAGLPVIDARLDHRTLADHDSLAVLLAGQRTLWEPGTRQGYHALTLGYFLNELLRRIDPKRRTIGRFLREEINPVLGEKMYVGLPPDIPERQLSALDGPTLLGAALHAHRFPAVAVAAVIWPWTVVHRSLMNPRIWRPGDLASPRLRRVEIPSANGLATARGLAALFGELAVGGRRLGITEETASELRRRDSAPPGGRRDMVVKMALAYSAFGFFKPVPAMRFGSTAAAFASPGAGGTFAFAEPSLGLGYAYTTNRMGYYLFNDPRERSLRDAVMRCLRRA